MKQFDKETLDILAKFEESFNSAINADWARNPGHDALVAMQTAMEKFADRRERLNESCNNCVLRLIKETGRKFYADREAVINAANDRKAVEVSKADAETKKKVKVSANK